MLQPIYFQQNKNSGTTSTRLLLERERLLNSLASLTNNIETPTSLNPEGGFILIQQQDTVLPSSFLNMSGSIEFVGAGSMMPFTSAQISSAPISIYQPLTVQERVTASISPQEAYKLVKRSFESYKTNRQKYSSQRAKEIMSFIDDDNNE